MATFRSLAADDLALLRQLAGADALEDLVPVAAGIENSNWFLTLCRHGQRLPCVLTLVEAVPEDELPFFIALADTLAEADLPVPVALRLADGRRQCVLQDRPALLVPRLPGRHVDQPDETLCRAVGTLLAQLHRAAARCPLVREHPDHRWWPAAFTWLAPALAQAQHDELGAALLSASGTFARAATLPHGVIHGDLFRDNVLVTGNEVSGVLDFFHATRDLLAWDIAIALNDWALRDGRPDRALADAFLAGYRQVRELARGEQALLPALRQAAAARFWLSRLVAVEKRRQHGGPAPGSSKDPAQMQALYRDLARP